MRVRPVDVAVAALVLGAAAVIGGPTLRSLARDVTAPDAPSSTASADPAGPSAGPLPAAGEAGPSATPLPAVLAGRSFGVGVPGSVRADCVGVGDQPQLRSGQFVVAGFVPYRRTWRPGQGSPTTLRVTPLHLPQGANGLDVLAIHVGGDRPSYGRFDTGPAAWHRSTGAYLLDLPLLAGGRWQLVLGSGPDRGCFVLDLTVPPAR